MSYDAGAVTYRVDADTKKAIDGFDKLDKTLDDTNKGMNKVDQSSNKLNTTLKTLAGSIAAAFSVSAIKSFIVTTSAAIDEQAKFAQRIGISYEELQKLQFAASQTGVSMNSLNTGLQRMSRRLETVAQGAAPEVRKQLELMGIAIEDIANLAPEEQFRMIADAMAGLETDAQRTRAAFALFDTEGVALVNTLRDGSAALDDYGATLQRTGGIISDETAAAAAAFNDQLDILQRSIGGASAQMAGELLPALTSITSNFTEMVVEGDLVENIIKGIGVAAQATAAIMAGRLIVAFTQTVAQFRLAITSGTALTGVMTGLRTAMAFLGGPAGVVLLAAVAIKTFADNSRDAVDAADLLAQSTDNLTKSQAQLANLDIAKAIEQEEAALRGYEQRLNLVKVAVEQGTLSTDKAREKQIEWNAAIDGSNQKIDQLKQRQQELNDIIAGRTTTAAPAATGGTTIVSPEEVKNVDRYNQVTKDLSNQFRVLQLQASGLHEEAQKLNDQFTAEKLLGGEGTPQQIEDVIAGLEGIRRAQAEIEAQEAAMKELEGYYRDFGNAAANAVSDVTLGVKSLDDALKDMAKTLLTQVANSLIQSGISAALGSGSSGGYYSYFGRSTGGPISAGNTYRVNEVGTEGIVTQAGGSQYYTPLTSGQSVVSSNQMNGGGGGDTINITVNSNGDVSGDGNGKAQMIAEAVSEAVGQVNRSLQSSRGETARALQQGYNVEPNRR